MHDFFSFFGRLIESIMSKLYPMSSYDTQPPEEPIIPASVPSPAAPLPDMTQEVYTEAVSSLGKHLTLNAAVSEEVGCAEALSTILLNVGYPVPPKGIPTVWGLVDFMLAQGFKETQTPVPGAIIAACRADRQPTEYAHIGIVLKYGIASNNSMGKNLGKWTENYHLDNWKAYFGSHGSDTRYFLPSTLSTPHA